MEVERKMNFEEVKKLHEDGYDVHRKSKPDFTWFYKMDRDMFVDKENEYNYLKGMSATGRLMSKEDKDATDWKLSEKQQNPDKKVWHTLSNGLEVQVEDD